MQRARARARRRGGKPHTNSISRYYRKKFCQKYPDRFIQGLDYVEIDHDYYKYKMVTKRVVQTGIKGYNIKTDFFWLKECGELVIFAGYCWDGPSGPTVDTPSFIRSSAVHDILFQIMREGRIPDIDRDIFFDDANLELYRIGKIDGMNPIRALWVWKSVDSFGWKHTLKEAV